MNNLEKLTELQERRQAIESVCSDAKQNNSDKKTARTRIKLLFDEGSFVEVNAFVTSDAAAEGIVTGYGTVDGRLVYGYAQDFTTLGGALGMANSKKISNILDMASKMGAPVVSIIDSNGAKINEGIDALAGIGELFAKNARLSGVVPQISLVLGPCAGGAVYTPAMSDFVFMVDKISSLFMTGPAVTLGVTGENFDTQSLGGAKVNAENGMASFVFADEETCFYEVRKLISFLPSNNLEISPVYVPTDDINRISEQLNSVVPDDGNEFDILSIIKEVVDDGEVLEISSEYAKNIVTAFVRLNGATVGIVANQSLNSNSEIDINAANKAAKFISFCDSFNISIVTFVDVAGFVAGENQEKGGISKSAARLLYAYAEATVPKVTVVVRRAYGSAYLAMGSKSVGADIVLAYPTAEISIAAPEVAANIMYVDEIAASKDPINERKQKIEEYRNTVAAPYVAAAKGYIDDIIEPDSTRPRIISALEMLASKRESTLSKKHGNILV